MATRMQQRRGTSAQWTSANPVLASGEIGFETDTNKLKIGDGVNTWANLVYFVDQTGLAGSLGDYVELASVGVADGVASLDSTGNVPSSQLGNVPAVDLTGYATEGYVTGAINSLIDLAPGALDTLNELAAAINDDPNFSTTISGLITANTNAIATKKTEISQAVSSNITLAAGYRYFVNTTAARTLTLPASPALGAEVQIFDANGSAGTNNITVNRNGQNINGIADNALLDVNGVAAVFVYTGATYGWRMG